MDYNITGIPAVKKYNMWIDKEFKTVYMQSPVKGLRLHFQKGVNADLRKECVNFCKWLRKNFWFPIRVNLYILECENFYSNKDSVKTDIAVFYYQKTWDEKERTEKVFPRVCIATGKYGKQLKRHGYKKTIRNYLVFIAHELTHYYQWFFYEFAKRTNRSIEYEATRWAHWLVNEFEDEL